MRRKLRRLGLIKRYAFDVIGSREKAVAILGVNINKDEKAAAHEIMQRHKNVKSVLRKLAERSGAYRLYPCRLVAGNRNTEVLHREHGFLLKLDPQKVYFSPRESEERKCIARLVQPTEKILVLFSGVAPYAIMIAKKQPSTKIVCIDINPNAIKYAQENVKLNKLGNIQNICADVRAIKLGTFNRIIMPFVGAINYLDVAFAHAKKNSIIHLYGISHEEKNFKDLASGVRAIAKRCGVKYKILRKRYVLPYAPRRFKGRVDVKVL